VDEWSAWEARGRVVSLGGQWPSGQHGRPVVEWSAWEARGRVVSLGGLWPSGQHGRPVVEWSAWEARGHRTSSVKKDVEDSMGVE
jgi:hypothetical protein